MPSNFAATIRSAGRVRNPRNENGDAQGGGGAPPHHSHPAPGRRRGQAYQETRTPGRRRGQSSTFQSNPREEEGAGPKPLGRRARISGAATPGRRKGPPPFRPAQGGGRAVRTVVGSRAPNLNAAPPGRRREGAAFPIRPREEEGASRIRLEHMLRYKGRRHQGGGMMPTLLLQAPGRRTGPRKETYLP